MECLVTVRGAMMSLAHREIAVRLESKTPHNTLFLHVWASETDPLTELRNALCPIGWYEDKEFPPLPSLNGMLERYFAKHGSNIFHGWTPTEKTLFTRQIRNALRRLGFPKVPYHKLTLADLL